MKKTIKAWAVLGTQRNKGGLEYSHGWPMIFIQRTKPKVEIYGKFPPVVPATISFTITKPKKKNHGRK